MKLWGFEAHEVNLGKLQRKLRYHRLIYRGECISDRRYRRGQVWPLQKQGDVFREVLVVLFHMAGMSKKCEGGRGWRRG